MPGDIPPELFLSPPLKFCHIRIYVICIRYIRIHYYIQLVGSIFITTLVLLTQVRSQGGGAFAPPFQLKRQVSKVIVPVPLYVLNL